ncbi:hypothetical protein BRC92_00780 [Halobacteriales archaeon QS_4_69_31]|nr:MAG: hypothetical protein BRC92_00780 [Halobacteriales archaeon QS_4_69_31]
MADGERAATGHTGYQRPPRTATALARIDELESGETTLAEVAAPPMTVAADAPVNTVIDQRLGLES